MPPEDPRRSWRSIRHERVGDDADRDQRIRDGAEEIAARSDREQPRGARIFDIEEEELFEPITFAAWVRDGKVIATGVSSGDGMKVKRRGPLWRLRQRLRSRR